MTKKEQLEIERQRRETALKNTFFNRYLLLRYTIALFFFGNIYWLLNQFIRPSFVIVLPITLIVLAILATVEQFRLYGKRDERLKVTQMFVRSQAVIQVGLLVLLGQVCLQLFSQFLKIIKLHVSSFLLFFY